MTFFKPSTVVLTASALALSGCVADPVTGQQSPNKSAMYGLGGAAVCGIVGALTHSGKGARNSALACGAIGAGVGGYMDYQEQRLRQNLADTQIEIQRQGNQIRLVMPESVTFATGSAALGGSAQYALNTAAQTLVQYPDTTLTINGHTDNTGSDAVNNPLSQHRAQAVAYYLQTRGVAASRLTVYGYGSHMPVASNATVEGRAQNRRVEILINPDQRAVNAARHM
ncbi:OmpA family protein [Neisseria gonorrhoeae]|uniref:OmpA family protein n=3 Tax=Neisseria gonorrhoeae TaxID=485 RepID=UPI000303CC27|nr:OmpA family protein [Neisseria gonorrhoeae]MBT8014561.1 OmpA family protein [Neisseria gonorrhoeae]MBT8017343.1 OmpA family protein [Neisseria gonorrhoeae]MCF2988363.1 OmpA family protein [Neisseria gonorrhoeae]MCF3065982.1 OmpA family protein [Neisseria gonorrhoeae]MCH8717091.1 OmpA family protein [Neisseria gonorrhoeae]